MPSKSAALLAAPGVSNPTAFYACINILHFLSRGGPQGVPGRPKAGQNFSMLGPCWRFFRSQASFFRSWPSLARLLAVFAHVGRFFRVWGRSGFDFGGSTDNFGRSETSFFDALSCAQVRIAKK